MHRTSRRFARSPIGKCVEEALSRRLRLMRTASTTLRNSMMLPEDAAMMRCDGGIDQIAAQPRSRDGVRSSSVPASRL